jgi:hypothetical protein
MTDDKILFLSFQFISDFKVEFVRETYPKLVKELDLKGALGFDSVLNWFEGDKISISDEYSDKFLQRILKTLQKLRDTTQKYIENGTERRVNQNTLQFSHPSYSDALPYLLVDDGDFTRINKEIFSKLMLKLSEKDEAAWAVALAVAANFDKLPDDVRNRVLFKLSENDKVASNLGWSIILNSSELPDDVRNRVLFKLSENDKMAVGVAWAVEATFNHSLPEDVRNKLLFKLSEKDEAAWAVALAVAANFDKLPDDVKNLLDKLQKPLQQVIEARSKSEKQEDKEVALVLISNALSKINQDFALKFLKELSECEHESVKIEAAKMLKDSFDDSEGKKRMLNGDVKND